GLSFFDEVARYGEKALPGYAGTVHAGVCGVSEPDIKPRWWCRAGEPGAWIMVIDEILDALGDQVADLPDVVDRRSAGSGISESSTVVGSYGHTSPQPIVTAQSACSCISTDRRLGLRSEMSVPISRITSTPSGQ